MYPVLPVAPIENDAGNSPFDTSRQGYESRLETQGAVFVAPQQNKRRDGARSTISLISYVPLYVHKR